MQIIIFMVMGENMADYEVLKGTRINILKKSKKLNIKDEGVVNFILTKYISMKKSYSSLIGIMQ
jgi:hypothetical protein